MESFCYKHSPQIDRSCPTCLWAIEENNARMGSLKLGCMGYEKYPVHKEKEVATTNMLSPFDSFAQAQEQMRRFTEQHQQQQWQLSNALVGGWDVAGAQSVNAVNNVTIAKGTPVFIEMPPKSSNKLLLLIKKE